MIVLASEWNIEQQTLEILIKNTETEKCIQYSHDPKKPLGLTINGVINKIGHEIQRIQE